jgi:8-oxo-dGTP pyrophosphatase MutT (NUDIX family)
LHYGETMDKSSKVQVWVHSLDAHGVRHVLLLRVTPERGSFWQPVTGGVEAGESLENAAFREVTEETGVSTWAGPVEPLNYQFEFRGRFGDAIETAYAIQTLSKLPKITLDPREHVEYEWVTPLKAMSLLKFTSNQEGLRRLMDLWQK